MTGSAESATGAVVLRDLAAEDLDALMEIENACFSTPWRRDTFEGLLLREDTDLLAATLEGRLVGYSICWTIVDQSELGNLAVATEARGRGIGVTLVHASLERLRRRGARECFLEVRESNQAARSLYERTGFAVIGRRRRYYTRPVEDALVMRAELI